MKSFLALMLALLGPVSSALLPGKLKGDLAEEARKTTKLIELDKIYFYFDVVQSVVKARVLKEPELSVWQQFIDVWSPRMMNIAQDVDTVKNFIDQYEILLLDKTGDDQINQYSLGAYKKLKIELRSKRRARLAEFEDKAREIIIHSTDSTGHCNPVIRYFNLFARAIRTSHREQHFLNLYQFLTLEGVELDEWLALDIDI